MTREKIRVLIISGTLETSLRPVPPVADGAPEWNVFRLAEAAACNPDGLLDIHVISPCEDGQVSALRDYPVQARGKYHHIVFKPFQLNLYRKLLRHLLPLRLAVRRLAKLPDLMSWWYLRRALFLLADLQPDCVIINDRPQYIRFLRSVVIKGNLILMLRHPVGESSRFLNLLDGVIVNSSGMKSYVEQFMQSDLRPVYKIPNTLDNEFSFLNLMSERYANEKKIILFVGRLIEEKGARELLFAFQEVLTRFPGCKLIFCGVSSQENSPYEQELRHLSQMFPKDSVEFMGYIPNHQMKTYYLQASVAVFPSLPEIYLESFGMVALEAMHCGTPVIASRQPGFEELVVHGQTGLLVDDPRDSDSLAQAILQILSDAGLAQKMGRAGYERSMAYTPDSALIALEQIMSSVVMK